MGFEVDTSEVRRAAKEIKRVAQNVRTLSDQDVKRMQVGVIQNLEGETANAITEVLNDLSADIIRISAGLSDIEKALLDYAERVEEADRKAEQEIKAN